MTTGPRAKDSGFAMVAAVAAIAIFALAATALVARTQAGIVTAEAQLEKARAIAAADAGIEMALASLIGEDRAFRWSIDGRSRRLDINGSNVEVRVEDETGKVPLSQIDEEFAEYLIQVLKLDDQRGRIVRDSLLDWIDDDDVARPDGAESSYYQRQGYSPRNGAFFSIDELLLIRGFDSALVDRMRKFTSVHSGFGAFEPRYAQPQAIEVMLGNGQTTPQSLDRQRELNGQTTAIELGDAIDLIGRPLLILSTARTPGGGKSSREAVVELTGAAERPYIVKAYQ